MHIGLLISSTPGYSETFFTSKIKGLIENGYKVTIFCQNKTEGFNLCNVKLFPKIYTNLVIQLFMMGITFIGLVPHYKKISAFIKLEKQRKIEFQEIIKKIYLNAPLFKSNLDWVHFGFATTAIDRELIPKAIGAKLAVSFRGFDIAIYPLKYPRCYDFLWEHIDKVHTISNDLLHLAYNIGLSKQTLVQKITPAIDIDKFNPKLFPRNNNTSRTVKFMTVARLHWKKGLIDTLKALAHLRKKGVKFEYTIIGEGSQFEELTFALYHLELTDNVRLVGKKSHNEVVAYMADADIYIQYSQSEGFCNAVLEAQAMQLLCVVSDAEGLSENVLDGVTGFVVPRYDCERLSEEIFNIIELDKKTKYEIRNQARERILKQFNLELQKESFFKFYK